MVPKLASPEETRRRKIVGVNAETVTNISSTDFPGHYPGEDHSWSLEKFHQNFHVQFHKNDSFDTVFSLIGVDASIANAFRRILIAEIPTLAIGTVFVHNNTSVVHDEVLASRLGLVPLTGALNGLNWMEFAKKPKLNDENNDDEPEPASTDKNTVVLKLQATCDWRQNPPRAGETDPEKLYVGSNVYADQIEFVPQGRQPEFFPSPDGIIRPVNPKILLAKMRPGQVIDLDMHCFKGIGADHAKWSPVATATYRLLPTIDIIKPILGDDAKKFARCFPKGVIGLENVTEEEGNEVDGVYRGRTGEKKAIVKNTFKDTVSRECLRHQEFKDKVKLGRVQDHFIFSVESTGQFDSDYLFLESVRMLRAKCTSLKRSLANVMR
ncbi:DNA-directed RNA polymerase core subunit rpc40 [Lecanora helva]